MRGLNFMRWIVAQVSLALMVTPLATFAEDQTIASSIVITIPGSEIVRALRSSGKKEKDRAVGKNENGSNVYVSKADLELAKLYVNEGEDFARLQAGASKNRDRDIQIRSMSFPGMIAGKGGPKEATFNVSASDAGNNGFLKQVWFGPNKDKLFDLKVRIPFGASDSEIASIIAANLPQGFSVNNDHIMFTDKDGKMYDTGLTLSGLVNDYKSQFRSGSGGATVFSDGGRGGAGIAIFGPGGNQNQGGDGSGDSDWLKRFKAMAGGGGAYGYYGVGQNPNGNSGGIISIQPGALSQADILRILQNPDADRNAYNQLIAALRKANPNLANLSDDQIRQLFLGRGNNVDPRTFQIIYLPQGGNGQGGISTGPANNNAAPGGWLARFQGLANGNPGSQAGGGAVIFSPGNTSGNNPQGGTVILSPGGIFSELGFVPDADKRKELADYLYKIMTGQIPFDEAAVKAAFQKADITDPSLIGPWIARFKNLPSNGQQGGGVSFSGGTSSDDKPKLLDWTDLGFGYRLQVLGKDGNYENLLIKQKGDGWVAYREGDEDHPLWFGKADPAHAGDIKHATWSASEAGAQDAAAGRDASAKQQQELTIEFLKRHQFISGKDLGYSLHSYVVTNGTAVRIVPASAGAQKLKAESLNLLDQRAEEHTGKQK